MAGGERVSPKACMALVLAPSKKFGSSPPPDSFQGLTYEKESESQSHRERQLPKCHCSLVSRGSVGSIGLHVQCLWPKHLLGLDLNICGSALALEPSGTSQN